MMICEKCGEILFIKLDGEAQDCDCQKFIIHFRDRHGKEKHVVHADYGSQALERYFSALDALEDGKILKAGSVSCKIENECGQIREAEILAKMEPVYKAKIDTVVNGINKE